MAQFTTYSSSDASAPQLSGTVGSLLAVLDACLVNGFGTKAAAGWTKPIANAGNVGHYRQGASPNALLHINDNGPNVTSTYKEAWATGWRTMSAITAPVGVGGGQFPLPWQLLTTGHTVIRKSSAADATPRQWLLYADNLTFYLFILSLDSGVTVGYLPFYFGCYYSFAGASDQGRCFIQGRMTENSTQNTDTGQDTGNLISWFTPAGAQKNSHVMQANNGCYSQDSIAGNRGSLPINKMIDTAYNAGTFQGVLATPNPLDQVIYMSPVFLLEPVVPDVACTIRGKMRGLYVPSHPASSFPQGHVFAGTGDYVGKTFQCVQLSGGASVCLIEISNTLDTN